MACCIFWVKSPNFYDFAKDLKLCLQTMSNQICYYMMQKIEVIFLNLSLAVEEYERKSVKRSLGRWLTQIFFAKETDK